VNVRKLAQHIGGFLYRSAGVNGLYVGGVPEEDADYDDRFVIHLDGAVDLDALAAFVLSDLAARK
jgi:hypothetical protein